VQFIQPQASYIFGQEITFFTGIESETPVQEAALLFKSDRMVSTVVGVAVVEGNAIYYEHDVALQFVPAFDRVEYWFVLTLADGRNIESERYAFTYQDNRFDWQTLENDSLRVHWYAGEVSFAQFVMDVARIGVEQVTQWVPAPAPERVDIYIYDQVADYQFAQGNLGPLWAGGHANPASGLILVAVPSGPEQRLRVERNIPHELTHIMLYQATGDSYQYLPPWLNEGIASNMELYPIPDYPYLLEAAYAQGTLIPLTALCAPFPRETATALLSYAESASFVQYLRTTYGVTGIQTLVASYARGVGCEIGTNVTPIDKPLTQLERDWRSWAFAENYGLAVIREVLPWLVLLGLPLIGPLVLILGRRKPPQDEKLMVS